MSSNLEKHRSLVSNLSNKVKEICNPFLKRFNLNFFWYCRHYKDGTCVSLLGNADVEGWFVKNNLDSLENDDSNNSGFLFGQKCHEKYFWSHSQNELRTKENRELHFTLMNGLKEFFDITNGFAIIEKNDEFIDHYDFGAPRNNSDVVNFYINNLDILQQFINNFKDKSQNLRNQVEKSYRQLLSIENAQTDINKNPIQHKKLEQHLTNRELECFLYILKGQSVKEIANILYRSPKTIENHIDMIKRKLNCTRRSTLFDKAIKLGFITIADYEELKDSK